VPTAPSAAGSGTTRRRCCPSQLRALQRIGNAVGRANRLIADLLDFSQARVGSGLRVRPRTIDLHGVVHETLEDLRLAFAGRAIVHQRSGEGPCVADSDRLVQMIGNLVPTPLLTVRHGVR
jgi:sigma-B regulation protein RsbU (phosphoserine phosphatase)